MISHSSFIGYSTQLKQSLLNVILPLSCLLCRQPCAHPLSLCLACQSLIALPQGVSLLEETDVLFPTKGDETIHWQKIRCLSSYQSPVREMIKLGKFQRNTTALKVLGLLLAQLIENQTYDPDLVLIPVPLHQVRLLSRGYNQAFEIAKPLSKILHLTIHNHCIERTRQAKTQHFLSRLQRAENAKQLFQITGTVPTKVAVVDDIYTTGATMRSICSCLKEAGAEIIEVWIIARTLKQSSGILKTLASSVTNQ